MKKGKLRIYSIILLLFLYVLSAVLPFIGHKEVSAEYQNLFDASLCYDDETGTERVAYIEDNTDAMIYRLQMIGQAKEEIILSTFDFNTDEGGTGIMSALLDAAGRGVRVRVLIDGTSGLFDLTGNAWFKALVSHENVSIRIYNPINLLKPWKIQARLHDKYLIIDNSMYLLGGRNTNNLFLGDYTSQKNIDRDLFVYETVYTEDSSLLQLKKYFEQIWSIPDCREYTCRTSSKRIRRAYDELAAGNIRLREEYPEISPNPDWIAQTIPTNKISLFINPIDACNKEPLMWYSLHRLMLTGKDITINTPYIVCSQEMYDDLTLLCKQADNVNIITNDVAIGENPWGCTDYLNQKSNILRTGVTVYEYLGDYSSHTKTITIDDRISVIGSYNLDMRSTYLDTELMLVVDSVELNDILRAETESNISYSKSIRMDQDYVYGENYVEQELSIPKKIVYGILRVITVPIRRLL